MFNMKNTYRVTSVFRCAFPLLLVCLMPSLASAHPGVPGHAHGFTSGLLHPLTGLDHVCAMLAVGLWAAQCGGRARWLVPLTFVSIMLVGGILGMGGASIPCVEQGIAASVLVLGIFITAAVRLPLAASAAIVGLFALFHGFAHGAEMSGTTSGLTYGLGFAVVTAGLHLAGLGVGFAAQRFTSAQLIRYAGGAIAACGVYFCLAS
jgi:urease accessory protein